MLNNSPEAKWYQDRWLLGIMALAGVLGLIYNGVILIGYGPDEPRHMNYIKLLVEEGRLPLLERSADGAPIEYAGAHSLHPPLYYVVLAPFYLLLRGLPGQIEWHILRLFSLGFCLASLPLIFQIAKRAGNGNQWIARLATAHLALLPIFGMTSGVINNDGVQLFLVVLFFWLLAVKFPEDRSIKSAVILGVVFGLGAATKSTAIICNGAALIAYFFAQDGRLCWRLKNNWRRLGIILTATIVIAGFWYVRNVVLYGQLTPVEGGYTNPALPAPSSGILVMLLHDNFPLLFGIANWSIFYSLWSQKDWIPEALRQPIYWTLLGYCLLAAIGAARAWFTNREQDETQAIAQAVTYAAFAATWLACLFMALFKHWGWAEGGRYLLPALPGLAIFLACGWRGLVGPQRLPIVFVIWNCGLIGLNILTLYWLLSYLNPTFGPTI